MNELEISVALMNRLCKKAGAERVSEEGAEELGKVQKKHGIMLHTLEGKPLNRKILKSQLEKSQEDCSSTIIRGRLPFPFVLRGSN
jgi:hypothetical protein